MGLFSGLRGLFGGGKKKVKVLCVGLDNSGKSTVINRLKTRKAGDVELAPTVGFATEDFTKGGLQLSVYDMSGQGRYRNLWETFYKNVNAIIFVIDATDKVRAAPRARRT
jgi:ADP-ribosylation factor-like protein 6